MLFDERYSPLERMVNKGLNPSQFKFGTGQSVLSSSASATVGTTDDHDDMPSSSNPSIPTTSRIDSGDRASFIWGLWQCENELTFLLDESDIDLFPEGALEISPQRWKLIKLCGRAIDFDETGIVSAMSKIDVNVPSLNISTATTNCTLVPEGALHHDSLVIIHFIKLHHFISHPFFSYLQSPIPNKPYLSFLELLESTLADLSEVLKCPVRDFKP